MKNQRRFIRVTRAQRMVIEMLAGQPDPVDIHAIATVTGKHPNTVREHLSRLVRQGYVRRHRFPVAGRGRPAWRYSLSGLSTGVPARANVTARLTKSLAATNGPDRLVMSRRAGRDWGRAVAREHRVHAVTSAQARRTVVDVLDDHGYEPRPSANLSDIRLMRCPFLQAAHDHTDLACAVHLGLVEGLLESASGPRHTVDLLPFYAPGECRLLLNGGTGRETDA